MNKEGEDLMSDNKGPAVPENWDELDIQLESVNSAALARLVEEVRNDVSSDPITPNAYNRTYHRHNR